MPIHITFQVDLTAIKHLIHTNVIKHLIHKKVS